MKIIQSFWTKPYLHNVSDGRFNGGWPNERIHAISWAYSLLKLKEFHNDVMLITDDAGKKFLIDKLKLPYTEVNTSLNSLDDIDQSNWAIGKLKAYSIQTEPFIHVDSDVYIWENLFEPFSKSDIIMQSKLRFDEFSSHDILKKYIDDNISLFPKAIVEYWESNDSFYSANAGVCGGTNLLFFRQLFTDALNFINKTESNKSNLTTQWFNMLFEEHHIFCKAKQEGINIDYLIPNISEDFNEVCQIYNAPLRSKYIHLAGAAKSNLNSCYQLELRIRNEYPDVFERIDNLYSQEKKCISQNLISSNNSNSISSDIYERTKNEKKIIIDKELSLFHFYENAKSQVNEEQIKSYGDSYNFFKKASPELMKKIKLISNETLIFKQKGSNSNLIYYNHISSSLDEIVLDNIKQCLSLFSTPISINDISNLLINNGIIDLATQSKEKLEDALIDLVSWHLLNTHILKIAS